MGLKTNKGGLKHRKVTPKEVDLYPIDNLEWCPVRIIMKYLQLLPKQGNCESYYLQSKRKFQSHCWYQNRPAGVNKLRDVVKDVCKLAGIPGIFTNHSLRSNAVTKMYRIYIDEQWIVEITGHRSLAVRSYKRTSDAQCKMSSNCLFSSCN